MAFIIQRSGQPLVNSPLNLIFGSWGHLLERFCGAGFFGIWLRGWGWAGEIPESLTIVLARFFGGSGFITNFMGPASAPFAPGQVDTSSLVLSPLVVLEDCRGFVDSGSSLGPCMTPKVRSLDGVVCVLLLRGA